MLDLAFQPDRSSSEPLYRQLAGYLRGLVETARLTPGDRLPATRNLASALELSRNTVNQAYQALIDQELLRSHVGQGTFVASRPAGAGAAAPAAAERGFVWDGLVAARSRALAPWPALTLRRPARTRFDFSGGQVDLGALPRAELRRAYSRALAGLDEVANLRDPFGLLPLRREIARVLIARGIRCGPEDVAVVSGAQRALDLIARVLLDPGDTVAMEQPGYFGAALCFRAAEAHVVGVGVDESGLRTDELARLLRTRRVKLLYTTPSAQSPTGAVLSDARRRALLELADAYQLPVLEDDYDSEFRYGSPPLPALKTQDPAGQVIYLGTFSKALFPGLRLGYVVAARPLLSRLALADFAGGFGSDVLAQAAVTELLASGALERHVRRLRKLHAERREALLRALEGCMPPGARWSAPGGGHAVWVTLPRSVDADALHAAACEAGIAYTRGDVFYCDAHGARGADSLALSFVNQPPAAIAAGVARLGELVAAAEVG